MYFPSYTTSALNTDKSHVKTIMFNYLHIDVHMIYINVTS